MFALPDAPMFGSVIGEVRGLSSVTSRVAASPKPTLRASTSAA